MIISLCNVTKEYNLDEETIITPIQNVSLDIRQGEFILIIGRSGSGKTTLLNLVAGLIKPSSGEVLIDNHDLRNMTDTQLSSLRNRRMGFIFQFPSLLPSLTILQNVVLPTTFHSRHRKPNAHKRAADLLQMLGLGERKKVYPRQLSAGEQKRAVIARSLINEPEILLADEPTSDLDERTEQEIMTMLRETHANGMTIMMVTHSTDLIPYATRALKVEDGGLLDVTAAKQPLTDAVRECA